MDPALIVGEATTTVRASPREVYESVIDLDRYRQADHKIGRGSDVYRPGDEGTVRFWWRIRGIPAPPGTAGTPRGLTARHTIGFSRQGRGSGGR